MSLFNKPIESSISLPKLGYNKGPLKYYWGEVVVDDFEFHANQIWLTPLQHLTKSWFPLLGYEQMWMPPLEIIHQPQSPVYVMISEQSQRAW